MEPVKIRDERGFTLIELLVAMTLSLVVLGGVLTTWNQMYSVERRNDDRLDAVEQARNGLDKQARQLRNLARRLTNPVIDTLGPYDLIFQTSDPSRTWVRYCLQDTGTASRAQAKLWTATLSTGLTASPVTSDMRGPCPGAGWTTTSVVAQGVTNRRDGLDRPLFGFSCLSGTSCTANAATYDQVTGITAETFVDTTPGTGAAEARVSSGVFLRNQNQAPTASFVHSLGTGSRTISLNASASSDPENRTLTYYWFKGTMPALADINCANATVTYPTVSTQRLWNVDTLIGRGINLTYKFPASDGAAGTTRNIGLVVCDPGDRFATAGIVAPFVPVPIPAGT